LEYLKYSKDMEVVAILNLDTGDYNILKIFDQTEVELTDIKGSKDIRKATNLVVYYYK